MNKNLLRLLIVIAVATTHSNLFAQAPNYLWAKSAGGADDEFSFSCRTDAGGNIIVTGSFASASITFGTTVLTNTGDRDMYVVKYDPNGNVLWAKSAGGGSYDDGNTCSTDAGGNIIVTGQFNSSSISFDTIVLTNAGSSSTDMFIVKYDPNGNVIWAKSAGGTLNESGNGCVADADENIIVTGWFSSPAITFDAFTLTNGGYQNIFIVKYDLSGNVLWAKSASGTGADRTTVCATDANRNIIVTGSFNSDTLTFGTTSLITQGGPDMFLVKYDPNGNVLWANSAGGIVDDVGQSCSTDVNGNIAVTGYFGSPTITFGNTVLTCTSTTNTFIAKYDSSGNVLWAKSVGGNSKGQGCATDHSGNIVMTGFFYDFIITIDTDTFVNADNSGNSEDLFIVEYDSTGNILWAETAGGHSVDAPYDCCTDTSGNIIITGSFASSPLTFGTTNLYHTGYEDIFTVKLAGALSTGTHNIRHIKNEILLFPNPTDNHFTINLGSKNKNIKLTITDNMGKLIYKYNVTDSECFSDQKIEVNTQDYAEGIYFVQIQSGKFIETKKLMIAK